MMLLHCSDYLAEFWLHIDLCLKGEMRYTRKHFARFGGGNPDCSEGTDVNADYSEDEKEEWTENENPEVTFKAHEGEIDDQDMQVLVWLTHHLVGKILPKELEHERMVQDKKEITSWITPDDIAFLVLSMEHHANQWRRHARHQKEKPDVKLTVDEMERGMKYTKGNKLSGKEAQIRYERLRIYFTRVFGKKDMNGENRKKFNQCFYEFVQTEKRRLGTEGGPKGKDKKKRKTIMREDEPEDMDLASELWSWHTTNGTNLVPV
jgi:hypothetical protein